MQADASSQALQGSYLHKTQQKMFKLISNAPSIEPCPQTEVLRNESAKDQRPKGHMLCWGAGQPQLQALQTDRGRIVCS